jgi:hypothetical protein
MKHLLIGAFCLISLSLKSQTQKDETANDISNLKLDERKLDSLYELILLKYTDDPMFIKNFELAQNAWRKYYKLEVKAMFPDYMPNPYGSMFLSCESVYARKLIKARINEVLLWLVGSEDGECKSSIKPKHALNDKNR